MTRQDLKWADGIVGCCSVRVKLVSAHYKTVSSPLGCRPSFMDSTKLSTLSYPFSLPAHHTFPFYCATVFMLFRSFATLSLTYPSRATWTRRLSCLGRMCSLPLPFPLIQCPRSATVQESSFKLFSLLRHPSQATLACRLGCFGGAARGFSSRLATLVARLSSVLNFRKA